MSFVIWDWKTNPVLKGKLRFKLNNIPPYGKKLYGFELDNGEVRYAWGTMILVGLLAPLPFLTDLKVTYLGKGFEKPGDAHEKLLFELQVLKLPSRTKKGDAAMRKLERMKTKSNNSNIKT